VVATASDHQSPAGKLGEVLTAIAAEPGATLGELVSLTGWQPHTARAALTRLRQRGFKVHLHEDEGRRAYHLTQAARR
jgi:DNA-binding MarR family transcriptional regulator